MWVVRRVPKSTAVGDWLKLVSYIVGAIAFIVAVAVLQPVHAASETMRVGPTEDSYVEENYPWVVPWDNRNLYIGRDDIYNKGRTRTYMTFDLEYLRNEGITSADIVSARLYFFQYMQQSVTSYKVIVSDVTAEWEQSTLCWNRQPTWGQEVASRLVNGNGWYDIDVTDFVKHFLNDGNSGSIVLHAEREYSLGGIWWSTSCRNTPNPPSCNAGEEPYLVIEYVVNTAPTWKGWIAPEKESVSADGSVHIEWQDAYDTDGDSLTYAIDVAKDSEFGDIICEADSLTNTNYDCSLDSGWYYVRVSVSDGIDSTASDVLVFAVDITPPPVPSMHSEPPFTSGDENTVCWEQVVDNISENVEYQLCYLYGEEETCLEWQKDTCINIVGLQSGNTYCYYVKARDSYGNVSNASDSTCSLQDDDSPNIYDFQISDTIFSPSNTSSVGVHDNITISARVDDSTLDSWVIKIVDNKHKVVYEKSGTGKDILLLLDKNIWKFGDGYFFVYIEAKDKLNNVEHSEVLQFLVDDTSPVWKGYIGIKDGMWTNNKKLNIRFEAESKVEYKLKLNGEVICEGKTNSSNSCNVTLREGRNEIITYLVDIGGNNIKKSIIIFVDSIPPAVPQIKIDSFSTSTANVVIATENGARVKLYLNGRQIDEFIMNKKSVTRKINYKFLEGKTYIFTAMASDKLENTSKLSNEAKFKFPKLGTGGNKGNSYEVNGDCYINVFIKKGSTKSVKLSTCSFSGGFDDRKICALDNSKAYIAASVPRIKNVKVHVQIYECGSCSWKNSLKCLKCVWEPSTYFTVDGKFVGGSITLKDTSGKTLSRGKVDKSGKVQIRHGIQKGSAYYLSADGLIEFSFFNIKYRTDVHLFHQKFIFNKFDKCNWDGYFDFMFTHIIGVTQWHGATAFNSNHTGIDFGAYKEVIVAPSDGVVVFSGWDYTFGKCYSGGNLLIIRHDNGMYSAYMHLENYKRANGHVLRYGDRVKRGEQIGISGNTGAWACNSLGYHLHFELRTGRRQSTHVNPVPYINVDWDSIPTLGCDIYPGRLTGDNPHPGK